MLVACFCGDSYVGDLNDPLDKCPGCGVLSNPVPVEVPDAPPVEFTEAVQRFADSTREPRLHAFPPGSNVALCGRRRKAGEGQPRGGKHCTSCEAAARQKAFVGR